MKRIVAINCSPRFTWNTATLVREAAKGAEAQGAEVTVIDLYKLKVHRLCFLLWLQAAGEPGQMHLQRWSCPCAGSNSQCRLSDYRLP